jgi:hypothetical protein
MPRYFFHIRHGWDLVPDEEGMEFPDLNRARVEGYASARDLAAADPCAVHDLTGYAVEVADEEGTMLSRIKVESLYRVA